MATTNGNTLGDQDLHNLFDLGDYSDDWLFVSTPYQVPAILALYLLIVLKLGPQLMKARPPVQLNNVLRVYNLVQVVCNAFLVLRLVTDKIAIDKLINHSCSIDDHELLTDDKKLLVYYAWVYLVLKLSDLLDTVFMVLRKKDSHITFLHVYHHAAMVFFVWLSFSYSRSHHGLVPGFVNAIVHTVMYSYYFLATFPSVKPKLWWKQYLTKIQLGQFVVILLYFSLIYYNICYIPQMFTCIWILNVSVICLLFINFLGQFVVILLYFSLIYYNNCYIPQIFTYTWILNVSVICLLFINFYVKAYTTKKQQSNLKAS